MLVGTSPGIAAFGAAYKISRCLISRPCLHCPPVALCSTAFIAGYSGCRQCHIIPVGYNNLHLRILFAFHMILLFNIFFWEILFITASAFDFTFIRHQHLTAIWTEFHKKNTLKIRKNINLIKGLYKIIHYYTFAYPWDRKTGWKSAWLLHKSPDRHIH